MYTFFGPLCICVTGINLAGVKYVKGVLHSVTFLGLFQHKCTVGTALFLYRGRQAVVTVVPTA